MRRSNAVSTALSAFLDVSSLNLGAPQLFHFIGSNGRRADLVARPQRAPDGRRVKANEVLHGLPLR